VSSHLVGAVQQHFNVASARKIAINIPDISVQRAIVEILGSLDDKIELNRRMNETLEAIAQAIFNSWFVDFDPVRAKAEDRDTGLPNGIADLFPDHFYDKLPIGWAVKPFSDTVNIIGGGTPKTSVPDYWNGDIPWFSVVDAPNYSQIWVIKTAKNITQDGIENSSTRILDIGTTIISARGTVGKIALVGVPMAMNQSCYGLRGNKDEHGYFTYFSTKHIVSMLKQSAHGSVFDTITRGTLASIKVVVPPDNVIAEYEKIVHPIMVRIRLSRLESDSLISLRDTLLPKLISGEIRLDNFHIEDCA